MSAGDKDRASFHRVGGSLSQARSRDSTEKHEHCVRKYARAILDYQVPAAVLPMPGRAASGALGLVII
jgi:hypothetical protein